MLGKKMKFVCLWLGIYSLQQLCSTLEHTHTYEKMTGKRFQHASESVIAQSSIACCDMCPRTGQCALVSYNNLTRECEMSGLLPGDESYIQSELGWDLYFDTENECTSNPCQNSGVCQDGIGYYTCSCTTGWSGQNCETELCPVGWDQFEDSCYFIVTDVLNWMQAKANCDTYGGHLMNVKTEEEYNFLRNLYTTTYPSSDQRIWLGGTLRNGIYYWTDNTTLNSGYEYWYPDQPSGGHEYCLEIITIVDFLWNDRVCSVGLWSVCQKDLNVSKLLVSRFHG